MVMPSKKYGNGSFTDQGPLRHRNSRRSYICNFMKRKLIPTNRTSKPPQRFEPSASWTLGDDSVKLKDKNLPFSTTSAAAHAAAAAASAGGSSHSRSSLSHQNLPKFFHSPVKLIPLSFASLETPTSLTGSWSTSNGRQKRALFHFLALKLSHIHTLSLILSLSLSFSMTFTQFHSPSSRSAWALFELSCPYGQHLLHSLKWPNTLVVYLYKAVYSLFSLSLTLTHVTLKNLQ